MNENVSPHIMSENVFPLDVFAFGAVNLPVMLFVHGIHLLHNILSVRHELAHGVGNEM